MGVLGGVGALAKLLVDTLFGPGVMFLYPLYASKQAIDKRSTSDIDSWFTYWVLFLFITFFEQSFWKILQWFPLWGYVKLLLCVWLVLDGKSSIHDKFVKEFAAHFHELFKTESPTPTPGKAVGTAVDKALGWLWNSAIWLTRDNSKKSE